MFVRGPRERRSQTEGTPFLKVAAAISCPDSLGERGIDLHLCSMRGAQRDVRGRGGLRELLAHHARQQQIAGVGILEALLDSGAHASCTRRGRMMEVSHVFGGN